MKLREREGGRRHIQSCVSIYSICTRDTIDSSNIQHQHLHVCIVSFTGTLQERLADRRLTPIYHIISDYINYSFHVFTISGAFGVRDHWNPSMCFGVRSCSLHNKIWEIFVSPRALGNWLAIWCWLCSWLLILQQTWLSSIFLDIVGGGGTLQPQCCVRRIFSWRKSGGLSVGTLPRPTFFEATWTSLARSKRSSFKLFKRACIHPETSPKYSKWELWSLTITKLCQGVGSPQSRLIVAPWSYKWMPPMLPRMHPDRHHGTDIEPFGGTSQGAGVIHGAICSGHEIHARGVI